MGTFISGLQPAVKKETRNVALATLIGVVLVCVAFFVLNLIWPEDVPFNYTVILGGFAGGFIAVLNFFLMCLTVQKIASLEDEKAAQRLMKKSYSRRYLMQIAWIVIAIFAPCFNIISGLCPLLFPGLSIKLRGILQFRFGLQGTPAPAADEQDSAGDSAKE